MVVVVLGQMVTLPPSNNATTTGYPNGDMIFPYIPSPSLSSSRRVQQRQAYPARMTVDLSNQVLTALNHMSVSLSSQEVLSDLPLPINANARQPLQPSTIQRCHDRVYHACQRFRRLSGNRSPVNDTTILNELDKFDPGLHDHGYSATKPALMISSDKVSLPS